VARSNIRFWDGRVAVKVRSPGMAFDETKRKLREKRFFLSQMEKLMDTSCETRIASGFI